VGGFGDALARLRDPAQLVVQVELVVLGGWQAPSAGAAGDVPEPRREGPARAALPFTPARSALVPTWPPPSAAPAPTPAPVAQAPKQVDPHPPPTPTQGEGPGAVVPAAPPQAAGAGDGGAGHFRPDDDDPWPEPDEAGVADAAATYDAPPARPAAQPTPAAPVVASSPAPVAAEANSNEPPRSKWDGLGVGGGTVRAHWETDEDDEKETVRVVVEAPPPPPPTRKPSNGTTAATASASAAPVPAEVAASVPGFDFQELLARWPSLRDELWSNPIERAQFHSCELVGVEGARLVVQMSSGNLLLLGDEKKRAIRGELIRLLGKGTDVRFIDDKTPYTPPVSGGGTGVAVAAPAAPPLPTSDPVIQAGLRFFGGPLERLPDE
jgi:hypothetical protein